MFKERGRVTHRYQYSSTTGFIQVQWRLEWCAPALWKSMRVLPLTWLGAGCGPAEHVGHSHTTPSGASGSLRETYSAFQSSSSPFLCMKFYLFPEVWYIGDQTVLQLWSLWQYAKETRLQWVIEYTHPYTKCDAVSWNVSVICLERTLSINKSINYYSTLH